MAFVPAPDTVEIEAVFSMDGQIVENTFYYTSATPTLESATALLEAVNNAIRTGLLPLLSSTITLVRLVATLIATVDGFVVTSTTSLPAAGGGSADSLPSNVALCISKRTAARGRSFRGRNYIAGIPLDARSGTNELDSGFTSGVVDAIEAVLAAGADDGWTPTVISRFHNKAPRTTAVVTPVTSVIVVDNTMDSQRRRLPGRGA